jgi:hypothetical protein
MKLELLSPNLIIIVNKLIENQELLKLVNYNDSDCLSLDDIEQPELMINTKIYPYPNNQTLTNEQTLIKVYYGHTKIQNRAVENTPVLFDCITHPDLYIINDPNDSNKRLLRLYEITNRITEQFDNISVQGVGKLQFTDCIPIPLPDNFQMLRLIAKMMTIGL